MKFDYWLGCPWYLVDKVKYRKNKETYTIPILLMHTLITALLRTGVFKVGVQSIAVHVVLGIMISFMGPIVAAVIMEKTKWLEYFHYLEKDIKIS